MWIQMENGAECPYGDVLDKPINGGRAGGEDGFITQNNRHPPEASLQGLFAHWLGLRGVVMFPHINTCCIITRNNSGWRQKIKMCRLSTFITCVCFYLWLKQTVGLSEAGSMLPSWCYGRTEKRPEHTVSFKRNCIGKTQTGFDHRWGRQATF